MSGRNHWVLYKTTSRSSPGLHFCKLSGRPVVQLPRDQYLERSKLSPEVLEALEKELADAQGIISQDSNPEWLSGPFGATESLIQGVMPYGSTESLLELLALLEGSLDEGIELAQRVLSTSFAVAVGEEATIDLQRLEDILVTVGDVDAIASYLVQVRSASPAKLARTACDKIAGEEGHENGRNILMTGLRYMPESQSFLVRREIVASGAIETIKDKYLELFNFWDGLPTSWRMGVL